MIEEIKVLEIEKLLNSVFSHPIKIERIRYNFYFYYDSVSFLQFDYYEKTLKLLPNYNSKIHSEYFKLILKILRENSFEVNVRNNHLIKRNKLNLKIKNSKDIKINSNYETGMCSQTAYDFYDILTDFMIRKYSCLIYFNGEFIGINKFINNEVLLCLNSDKFEKYAVIELCEDVLLKIEKFNLFGEKGDSWFRVNLVGDKLPICYDFDNTNRFLHDFSKLMQKNEFGEVDEKNSVGSFRFWKFKFGKNKISIYKKLLNITNKIIGVEKDFAGEFDMEIKV